MGWLDKSNVKLVGKRYCASGGDYAFYFKFSHITNALAVMQQRDPTWGGTSLSIWRLLFLYHNPVLWPFPVLWRASCRLRWRQR
jgi:hypothetical protein